MKKQPMLKGFKKVPLPFGGSLLKGNPKTRRPLDSHWPILLTLRSEQSGMRMPKVYGRVHAVVFKAAKKHGVKIYGFENVGNHLHAVIRIGRVHRWNGFIREVTSKIAKLMGIKGFWQFRPHTRIVQNWRNGFKNLLEYLRLNHLQAHGFINRRETKTLKDYRAIFLTG